MPSVVVHALDTPWTSSAPVLQVTVEPVGSTGPGSSNKLTAPLGAAAATATFTPGAPLDLSAFDELRFWVRSDRPADGSAASPFWLELSYRDTGDAVGEEHRWFVPVNAADTWEQRRIGIAADRRTSIDRFRFTVLDDGPFTILVDELLAVNEQMLVDVEAALVARVGASLSAPGLTGIPVAQTANPNASQIRVPAGAPFAIGNRILVTGGTAGNETHDVTLVTPAGGGLALSLADKVVGTLTAGVAHVTVLVPVVVEAPPTPTTHSVPSVVVTPLAANEDPERTRYTDQRDSFRPRGALVACSVRPGPRAYLVDYQIAVIGSDRTQQVAIADELQTRLSTDAPLHVNGAQWPCWIEPTLPLLNREFGSLAPSIYLRVGGRAEIAPRVEAPWVQHVHLGAGRPDSPSDTEGLVIQL